MEAFLKSAIILLGVAIPITYFLMKWIFKKSVFKQISTIWVITILFNSLNTSARITLQGYPQAIAIPVGFVIIGLGIYIASRYIKSPLNQIVNSINLFSKGNLNVKIDEKFSKRNDEIGVLSESINRLSVTFNQLLSEIKDSSNKLSNISSDLHLITERLGESSDNQNSTILEMMESIGQISNTIIVNAEISSQTQKALADSEKVILQGNKTSGDSISSMKDVLNKIKIINDIAWRTNLLSLNASIEASKAGVVGKGFGVVASEIKKLSQKSNEAAEDIETASQNVMKMTENASLNLKNIILETKKSSELIKKITNSGIEQKTDAQQIDNSIVELKEIMKNNQNITTDISRMSGDIKINSTKLNEMLAIFNTSQNQN